VHFNISQTGASNDSSSLFQLVSVFVVNFTFIELDESRFEVLSYRYTFVFKSNGHFSRDLQVRQCTLLPALLEYHVLLTNDSIVLDSNFSYKEDQAVNYTPAHGFYGQGPGSTHGGMALVLSAMFISEGSLVFNSAVGYGLVTSGAPTYQYSRLQPSKL
jgi:hypothetical protein